ncbi:MAG: type II secretion system F family protein [Halobacteriota archaeon]
MWSLLPLLGVVVLCLPVVLSPFSRRANHLVSRVALSLFGRYVSEINPGRRREAELLRAAHVPQTHRLYASRTLLFVGLFGVTGSVVGVYVGTGVLTALWTSVTAVREAIPAIVTVDSNLGRYRSLFPSTLFVWNLVWSATLGSLTALGTYWIRWGRVRYRVKLRAREIEATLPRTVAFVFALSRSGMPFPRVLATLSRNQQVYGEAAREVGVAVGEMEGFGTDVLTALERMSSRTPSDNLQEFGDNLVSVLGSGRSLSEYLRSQYERYLDEAESRQEQYLELLATFAEVYVTALVAGPLFLITILTVIGLVIDDTLLVIKLVTYLGLPVASLAFVLYVDRVVGSLEAGRFTRGAEGSRPRTSARTAPDGGGVDNRWRPNVERLAAYDRLVTFRRWWDRPVQRLLQAPTATFVATVPLGLAWVLFRSTPLSTDQSLLEALDGPVVEATLFAFVVFAAFYEVKKYRQGAIEDAVPDFLDRMASTNEAGLPVVDSIRRLSKTDLGALTEEIQRTRRDIGWGAEVQTALYRMQRRTGSPTLTRAMTLISNAMIASGDISPILKIAADEAQQTRRLRRERRQEMFTYLLVIYISFLVFVGITVALTVAFIPAVDATSAASADTTQPTAVTSGVLTGLREVNTEPYKLLFFHITAIQGVCSGLVAGLLGAGRIQDGVKHATLLLGLSYVTFLVV